MTTVKTQSELVVDDVELGDEYDLPAPDVDGLADVDWHVRKVREYRDELAALDQIYRAELSRIQTLWEERQRIIGEKIAWHLRPVESWHRAHPDSRTIELPHGTLKLRVAKSAKVFLDPDTGDELRAWALSAHPEVLRDPLITDIRRVVKIAGGLPVDPVTGEVVPGVHVAVPEPTWSLDTDPGSPL